MILLMWQIVFCFIFMFADGSTVCFCGTDPTPPPPPPAAIGQPIMEVKQIQIEDPENPD